MKTLVCCILIFFIIGSGVLANGVNEKLVQLKQCFDQGLISQAEFDKTKTKILSEFSNVSQQDSNESISDDPVIEKNLFAVIPFYGKVYSDGDRDTIAKFTVKNMNQYILRNNIKLDYGILEFHVAKSKLLKQLNLIDPDKSYDKKFLQNACKILNVRYLCFGKINHYSFEKFLFRFNVLCQVYDCVTDKIVFKKRARQSSRHKFFDGFINYEKGKTIAKISEQFYFFINQIANNGSMLKHSSDL